MTDKSDRLFRKEMLECGYFVDNPANADNRHVINVARSMWDSQQHRIDSVHSDIREYKRNFDLLGA